MIGLAVFGSLGTEYFKINPDHLFPTLLTIFILTIFGIYTNSKFAKEKREIKRQVKIQQMYQKALIKQQKRKERNEKIIKSIKNFFFKKR